MIESTRAACGACAIDRCEIKDHGPGVASDLLRGGLGGPGLGLDVLDDCAPSAALLRSLVAGVRCARSQCRCRVQTPIAVTGGSFK